MKWIRGLCISLLALTGACTDVEIGEKGDLGRRIMQIDDNDLEVAYRNKVLFSREVSGGKPGHSSGGGCGCSN